MVNSRGWFKVFEATVACLLVLGVFLFVFEKLPQTNKTEVLDSRITNSLSGIDLNETLRNVFLANDSTVISNYFAISLGSLLNYQFFLNKKHMHLL